MRDVVDPSELLNDLAVTILIVQLSENLIFRVFLGVKPAPVRLEVAASHALREPETSPAEESETR